MNLARPLSSTRAGIFPSDMFLTFFHTTLTQCLITPISHLHPPSSFVPRFLLRATRQTTATRRPGRVSTMAAADQPHRSMDVHGRAEGRVVAAAAERQAGRQLSKAHIDGTGQHSAHFAAAMPHLTWQPTEYSPECFPSIEAWQEGLPNTLPPAALDAAAPDAWPAAPASCVGVLCINMCHISPLACTLGLVKGAARVLVPGGLLFIYGPFLVDGKSTTESNAAFDANLRARNPAWGYRDVGDITGWAAAAGLQFVERVSMPANNFTLVFRREG